MAKRTLDPQVQVEPRVHKALKKYAEENGIMMRFIVNQALRIHLENLGAEIEKENK